MVSLQLHCLEVGVCINPSGSPIPQSLSEACPVVNAGYSTVLSGASPGGARMSCPPSLSYLRGKVKYSKKAHPFESLGASGLSLLGLYLCSRMAVPKQTDQTSRR